MRTCWVVVIALGASALGCRGILGIEDPVFIDGDVIAGVELTSLELSSGTLDRPFDGLHAAYGVALPLAASTLSVTAVAADTDLTAFYGDEELVSGEPSAPREIDVGASSITVRVRRETTGEESTYTLSAERLPRAAEALGGPGDFGDRFGETFHLDDDLLFVGAPCANAGAQNHGGKVYIYQLDEAGAWEFQTEVSAPIPTANGFFGSSIGHDSGVLAVGADGGEHCGVVAGSRPGAAFVFEQIGEGWVAAELTPSDTEAGAEFGNSISVDGDFIGVGAPSQTNAQASGAAFLFARVGGVWSQSSRLNSPVDTDGARFGAALDLNSNVLAVGAPNDRGGRVHVFHNVSGSALPLGVAAPTQAEINQHGPLGFGQSLSQDDDAIAIGGLQTESGAGAVWLFALDASESTLSFEALVEPAEPGDAHFFGAAVDLDEDLLVVGEPGWNGGTGRASLWQRSDGSWSRLAGLEPDAAASNGDFGGAIDLDEMRVVVGAAGEGNGLAHFFE